LAAPLSVAKTALPGLYLSPGSGEYLLRPSPPVTIHGATSLTLFVNLSLQEIERVLPSRGSWRPGRECLVHRPLHVEQAERDRTHNAAGSRDGVPDPEPRRG